jgi:amidophosphoribosyltransferase
MHPCYYGIDIPTREELIAAKSTPDEIGKYLKVNSLAYLSQKGMQEAAGEERSYCMACFNGDYPCSPESDPYLLSRGQKELFDDVDVSP